MMGGTKRSMRNLCRHCGGSRKYCQCCSQCGASGWHKCPGRRKLEHLWSGLAVAGLLAAAGARRETLCFLGTSEAYTW